MDSTKMFDGYANDYTVGRPGYAAELIDCLYNKYGVSKSSIIADIGSGTGKFAKHLLDRGSHVYCVEPNDDMRRVAEEELSTYHGFHSINSDAETTTLDDNTVDFITSAQAFHWFDVLKFHNECKRILKANGKVFLNWNVRNMDEALNKELYQIYRKYCPNFKGFSGGIEKDDQRIRDFFDEKYEYVAFDNPLYLDRERFIARSLSGSYSLKEGDKEYTEYMKAIEAAFEKYANKGIVSIANRSVAYIGNV